MVRRKVEEINFTFIECLLYIFHHLAHKTPNATNSLCGYKIVMGQPSDRLGEDFSEYYKDFTERVQIQKDSQREIDDAKQKHEFALALAKRLVNEESDWSHYSEGKCLDFTSKNSKQEDKVKEPTCSRNGEWHH
ncbi:Apoptosis inhibitor 5-like protein API5 [Camellia lanceoleosa]|uniref:Apoptosis inhibitor 5-like protein API5 n=1 Tax=Camellia lanceoleosa TaxID=1840588 RepID=A0ACC0GCL4_9ERIC|nr:Apoptosis inhibitor 5-like protein API5 [Camellia lanceoleosa]